ncbi:MAG: aromatic ring-hydroxylating dioxygenase subunit alpha [Alphaproteobacteria bacterium]|nr:MAG: aromatic ring-hydroxylating dioxygenase subunit alpha [Alphaproteobacteria bacterium]
MNFNYKQGFMVNPEARDTPLESFDKKAPYIDNGTGRVDPARYYDRAWMQREWERMWTRTWLLACPVADVPEPGDYFRFDVGPESFVIVRGEDGAVRAFYNVCPHRGNRIVHNDFGSLGAFTCSFHSWQFGLDGKNVRVTDEETFRKDVLCHEHDLPVVKCETACGFVFISMRADAPPVREFLGPIADHLDRYEIDKMHVVHHKVTEWAANWKTGVDAFYETYHLHAVHPQTQGVMEDLRVQYDLYPGGMSRMYIPFARPSPRMADQDTVNEGIKMMLRDAGIDPATFNGSAQDARRAIQRAKRQRAARLGLDYSRFTDAQLSDSVPYGIFPNVQLGCHVEGVFLMRFFPHPTDPERFYYDNCILYRPVDDPTYTVPEWMGLPKGTDTSGAVRPDIVRVPFGAPPGLGDVLDQDSELLPIVQQGIRSRGFKGPLWSEQEIRLRHFHRELDRYMAGEK